MLEAVIKVGGSLGRGAQLPALGQALARLGTAHAVLIVPGGGDFADTVRDYDRRYGLRDTTAHWMAVLAMDQYGYLLSDQIPGSVPLRDLASAHTVAQDGRVPVLLPCALLQRVDPLPHRWTVTSDSIAAWIAGACEAQRLVLLKDVDGLYRADPKGQPGASLLPTVRVAALTHCGGVDLYLATLLKAIPLDVWVINGTRPERLEELLRTGETQGTHVRRSKP